MWPSFVARIISISALSNILVSDKTSPIHNLILLYIQLQQLRAEQAMIEMLE